MKVIKYSKDARKELLSGVEIIAKAVKTTLGPSGANVLIRNKGEARPFSTKDGVTVAGQISSSNPVEQVAIESLQDIANIADEGAGDGTTTATVIAEAILKEGMKNIDQYNLFDVKRGMEETSRLIVEVLQKNAIQINTEEDREKLRDVAMISSNGDKEIADLVFDAFAIAGKQGIVNIKRSRSYDSYVKALKGMTLPVGYISKYYVNTPENTCTLEKPWIFMTNKKLTSVGENLSYFLARAAERQESVMIMCNGVDPSVSEMFIRNVQQGSIRLGITKLPGFGNEQEDLLRDLGTVLGKDPFLENEGIDFEELNQEDLFEYIPRCKEVIITEHTTNFSEPFIDVSKDFLKRRLTTWINDTPDEIPVAVPPSDEDLEKAMEAAKVERSEKLADIEKAKETRAEILREEVRNTTTQYEKSVLQTRISRLSDGMAFINIGAYSDTEFREKQDRVHDALYAVKAAYQEGIIPGGGAFLFSVACRLNFGSKSNNESMLYGTEILLKAIQRPMLQIIENVGDKLSENDLDKIALNFDCGYNAVTRKVVPDMIKEKIIDPAKVTRVALISAVSIASMILTTECVVVDTDVYDKPKNDY